MAVEWLTDLEAALFAQLPAYEERFVWQDTTYTCERSLEEHGTTVVFVERWRDVRSGVLRHTWRLPINPRAWGGLPAPLQAQVIALLCASIAQARPRQQPVTPPATFVPSRFGNTPS